MCLLLYHLAPEPSNLGLPALASYAIMLALLHEDHAVVVRFDVAPKGPNQTMRSIEDDTTTPVGTRFIASASHDREPVAATVTIADIWEAHKLLKPRLHHTPLTP